jgi:hypothetical protein
MCAAMTLLKQHDQTRRLFLYDTFEGMAAPEETDIDHTGVPASTQLAAEPRGEQSHLWAYSPLETVQRNIASTGYPAGLVQYVRGKVEDTIPGTMPDAIALLRLDTDWYKSTMHELRHLFPRLVKGGVLIIDDYGHWQGARRAVDEYFQESETKILLNRIDYTGRIGVR